MAEKRVQRRLAAILAADVVGYSRLIEADEEGTRVRLRSLYAELIDPRIAADGGRIVKTTGDGILVEFPSAVDAVRNALAIQAAMTGRDASLPEDRRIVFRVGINVGDVIVEGDDIHGDGVNVASRLEGLCGPGEVYVSGTVYDQAAGKLAASFEDLGEQTVKNITKPVRLYRARAQSRETTNTVDTAQPLPLPDKPAVAVLPFDNLSRDPDQDYFADGLTEDIITALSLWRSFPVIARNSTFAYKGQSPDIRKVGKELGARYVVEGSVRRAGSRVRISAQLINAETGHHVWAERYDREMEDIFDLQDEITHRVAAIIEPELERAEKQRIVVKPTTDLSAWEYCLRGYSCIEENSAEANRKARDMFRHAIDRDPNYARAHTGLAFTYVRDLRYWQPDDREEWERLFSETTRRAVELDKTDSVARTMMARVFMRAKDFDAAVAEARRAVECNPHDAYSSSLLGDMLVFSGHFEEGIPWIERSRQLNPMDSRAHLISTHLAMAHLGLGHYGQAADFAREAIRRKPDFAEPHMLLASALGYLDRSDEARSVFEPIKEDAGKLYERRPELAQVTRDCIIEGLRRAGLAE